MTTWKLEAWRRAIRTRLSPRAHRRAIYSTLCAIGAVLGALAFLAMCWLAEVCDGL